MVDPGSGWLFWGKWINGFLRSEKSSFLRAWAHKKHISVTCKAWTGTSSYQISICGRYLGRWRLSCLLFSLNYQIVDLGTMFRRIYRVISQIRATQFDNCIDPQSTRFWQTQGWFRRDRIPLWITMIFLADEIGWKKIKLTIQDFQYQFFNFSQYENI